MVAYMQNKPMIVLHIISGDIWAGAEVQVYHTMLALQSREEISVRCIVFNEHILNQKIKETGIPCITLDEKTNSSLSLLLMLIKEINVIRPHIIHVHASKEHVLAKVASSFFLGRIPIVRTVHGSRKAPKDIPWRQRARSSMVVMLDNLFISHAADAVIAVSKDLKREFMEQGIRGQLIQIYNGIDLEHCIVNAEEIMLRQRYNVGDRFWIGTAARLVEPKNLPMLINAGYFLKQRGIPCKISIFGEGRMNTELQEMIRTRSLADIVELNGFEPDIMPIIKTLDTFVLCSFHEGMPMALLEAMALKTPVVCTAVGGMREIVEDGVNGLLVPSGDSEALAWALEKLYLDPVLRVNLIENAWRRLKNQFSLQAAIEQLDALYNQLVV
jgi:L-malate glycosyltransferase